MRPKNPEKWIVCACGCGETFKFKPRNPRKKYLSPKHFRDYMARKLAARVIVIPKITCDKCGKEIPKECKKLNNNKCFMCNFLERHKNTYEK